MHSYFASRVACCYITVSAVDSVLSNSTETIECKEILAEVEASLILQASEPQFPLYRAHRVAIRNWLGRYKVSEKASGDERVRGYLEAYYHLRAIGAWRQATKVRRRSLRVKKDEATRKWQQFEQSFLTTKSKN